MENLFYKNDDLVFGESTPQSVLDLNKRSSIIRQWIKIKRALKKVGVFATEVAELDQAKIDFLSETITLEEFGYIVYEKFYDFKVFLNDKATNNDWDFFVDFTVDE
jgi:hypothetical protein